MPEQQIENIVNGQETATVSTEQTSEILGENGVKALKAEREQRKALEKQLKEIQGKLSQYETVSIEEYETLKQFKTEQEKAQEEARQKALEEKAQYEQAKTEIINKYESQLKQLSERLNEVNNVISVKDQALVQTQVNYLFEQAINETGGFNSSLLLKDEWIASHIKLENNQLIPVDQEGNQLTNGQGQLLTLNQWIDAVVKPKYPYLFKAPPIGGTGAIPSTTSAKGKTGISFEDFMKKTPSQILNEARQNGL